MAQVGDAHPGAVAARPWDHLDLATADGCALMQAHINGHPDAFAEVFRRYKDRMWAVALRTCGDRSLAEDAVQEAFLSAYRRASSYRCDAQLSTWLYRITVNSAIDRLRRRKPTTDLEGIEPVAPRSDQAEQVTTSLMVQQALQQLPEGQRLALVLVDMEGMSIAEAAQVLDVAEGTIKSRCARGRAALADYLRADPEFRR